VLGCGSTIPPLSSTVCHSLVFFHLVSQMSTKFHAGAKSDLFNNDAFFRFCLNTAFDLKRLLLDIDGSPCDDKRLVSYCYKKLCITHTIVAMLVLGVVKSYSEGDEADRSLMEYLEQGLDVIVQLGGDITKLSTEVFESTRVEETVEQAQQRVREAVKKVNHRATEAAHAESEWKGLDDASRIQLVSTTAAPSHDGTGAPPEPATTTSDGFVQVLWCGLGACVTRCGKKIYLGLWIVRFYHRLRSHAVSFFDGRWGPPLRRYAPRLISTQRRFRRCNPSWIAGVPRARCFLPRCRPFHRARTPSRCLPRCSPLPTLATWARQR
jgi:hypothetical protein